MTAKPFINVTVPVFTPAPPAVAVNVMAWPSLAGFIELATVVVVLLTLTVTVVLPAVGVPPMLKSLAVSVALPTVLFVTVKVVVPPASAALAGSPSPLALELTPT
jgi:hypothetical protein